MEVFQILFSQKLFGSKIEPACSYCKNGFPTQDRTMILCEKKGVVAPFYSCRKFVYAPLKRIPKRRMPLERFDESDFTL